MKRYILLVSVLFFFHSSLNAQSLRLLDIVQEPSPTTSVTANLSEQGGYISFNRTYRSGCVGGYKIKVTFSTPLSMLQPGETFQATLNCEDCSTPCGYKWRLVDLLAANNVTAIERFPNYVANENIELVSSSINSSGVNDWEPGMRTNIITLKYEPKKMVPLTAFQIVVAGDHKITFVFEMGPGGSPDPVVAGKPDLSCPWKSSYGDINWNEGYYSTRSKTIGGRLYQQNGQWVYEGTWGRSGSTRSGRVFFTFTSPTEFTGYWSEGSSNRQTKWTGSGQCLLIKR